MERGISSDSPQNATSPAGPTLPYSRKTTPWRGFPVSPPDNMGGCENPRGGSKVDTSIFAESGKYTITQTATIGGVNKTAKAVIPWDVWARDAAYVEVSVTSVS
ncbi:hypothetical protein O1611_g8744 [Lasiodiplodia mahajangana]|uniref:Uncharacterized protein n=1 Tax=Lasiodiplodia mahajangana TaxID=1108764 RepID=A0ACC2JBM8_9PEZI|nr:hypothetical protein O1611_g8744 [Lasiodiplodia mahajangana]